MIPKSLHGDHPRTAVPGYPRTNVSAPGRLASGTTRPGAGARCKVRRSARPRGTTVQSRGDSPRSMSAPGRAGIRGRRWRAQAPRPGARCGGRLLLEVRRCSHQATRPDACPRRALRGCARRLSDSTPDAANPDPRRPSRPRTRMDRRSARPELFRVPAPGILSRRSSGRARPPPPGPSGNDPHPRLGDPRASTVRPLTASGASEVAVVPAGSPLARRWYRPRAGRRGCPERG